MGSATLLAALFTVVGCGQPNRCEEDRIDIANVEAKVVVKPIHQEMINFLNKQQASGFFK